MEINLENVRLAHDRIRHLINRTPILTSHTLDQLCGRKVFFKCELFQKTGSFKARGALNSVLSLPDTTTTVLTHSSGNHGQAIAMAASSRPGVSSIVVMPNNSSMSKRQSVEAYGGSVQLCEPTQKAREETCQALLASMNATSNTAVFIHPSNNPTVINGQGTIALEIFDDLGVDGLDGIIVPIGGGGLISGICTAVKAINPNIVIIGGEPELANDAFLSKRDGVLVGPLSTANQTICDGLKSALGTVTWPIVRDCVDDVITVTDDEVRSSLALIWSRLKVTAEPSSAVGLAVLLNNKFATKFNHLQRVAVIICGGNFDLSCMAQYFQQQELK